MCFSPFRNETMRLNPSPDHGKARTPWRYALSMNDAQRETSDPGLSLRGEDLDVVLGRFKNWAETRRGKPSASPGAGDGYGRSLGEAREVSYEEALRASGYRRSVELAGMVCLPELNGEKAARVKVEEDLPRLAETHWKETPSPSASAVRHTHGPESRFVRAVEAITTEPPPVEPGADSLDGPHSVTQFKAEDRQPMETLRRQAKIGVAEASEIPAHMPRDTQVIQGTARLEPAPKPKSPATPRKQPLAQPAFRDVLKGTAALVAPAQHGAAPLERGKSTSLTLRVSEGEQARIQACAAQANLRCRPISASAP